MTPREIGRAEWRELVEKGEDVPVVATVRGSSVDIEGDEGRVEASLDAGTKGVDARIGHVQMFVARQQIVLVVAHPPYPIERWTVLYEGPMPE